jgi:glycosyltransferase involved in cell wall biosynthesis
MYTGHLYAGRGMEILLHLAQGNPAVNFLWVGGRSGDVAAWRAKVQDLGLKNILLTGFVPNVHIPLYQAAGEILLMPYERSVSVSGGGNTADICSPMKMFEYMACGRAILSSDLPVLREVLNENNAVLVPPEDSTGWQAALSRLVGDEALRRRLGAQARSDVAQYTWQERARCGLRGIQLTAIH